MRSTCYLAGLLGLTQSSRLSFAASAHLTLLQRQPLLAIYALQAA